MRADGESRAVEVGDQALFVVHGGEGRAFIRFGVLFEEWAGGADGSFHLPEGITAMKRVARIILTPETRRHGGITDC
jgi:hypothetical protein